MSEWKNLDKETPKIGQKVLVSKIFSRNGSSFEEVIYTNEHDLPLCFYSLDFMCAYPEIKYWLPLEVPGIKKVSESNTQCIDKEAMEVKMSEWTVFDFCFDQEIEPGDYIVKNENYFNYPVIACWDGKNFILGPMVNHLPASLPIVVTHFMRIPYD